MNLKDNETQLALIMVAFILYLISPVGFWFLLKHEPNSGAFPPESDLIGIPMFGYLVFWFAGLVIIPIGAATILWGRRILQGAEAESLRKRGDV